MRRCVPLLVGTACALLLAGTAGCGTSDYNSLVRRGAASLRGEVKFQGLYAPATIPKTSLSLRIPLIFTESYDANSGHPDDGEKISPRRLQPPFLNLPGLKLTYETRHKKGNERIPFYCYIAETPAQPGDIDKLAADLQAKLKQQFPDAPDTWDGADADTPDGFAVHWRKIRVEGDQPFFVKVGDKVEERTLPGIFELWIHDADGKIVLLGWRSPKSIEGPADLKFITLNNITIPPDNPTPDFSKWPVLTAGSIESVEPPAG